MLLQLYVSFKILVLPTFSKSLRILNLATIFISLTHLFFSKKDHLFYISSIISKLKVQRNFKKRIFSKFSDYLLKTILVLPLFFPFSCLSARAIKKSLLIFSTRIQPFFSTLHHFLFLLANESIVHCKSQIYWTKILEINKST